MKGDRAARQIGPWPKREMGRSAYPTVDVPYQGTMVPVADMERVTADHQAEVGRLKETAAQFAYYEWRVGKYSSGAYEPMWHELEERQRDIYRNRFAALIGDTEA